MKLFNVWGRRDIWSDEALGDLDIEKGGRKRISKCRAWVTDVT